MTLQLPPTTGCFLGLSSLLEILPKAINDFVMHPLDEGSTLPVLWNNKQEDGFLTSAAVAFQYFLIKDKWNRLPNQAVTPVAPPPTDSGR